MRLIQDYTDASRQGTTVSRYYEDDYLGAEVRIKVHQDPYLQQTYGAVHRWSDAGYQEVVTADPSVVFQAAKVDLGLVADELLTLYLNITGQEVPA